MGEAFVRYAELRHCLELDGHLHDEALAQIIIVLHNLLLKNNNDYRIIVIIIALFVPIIISLGSVGFGFRSGRVEDSGVQIQDKV